MQSISKYSTLVIASIIFSTAMISVPLYAALPQTVQADKLKLKISQQLKVDKPYYRNHESILKDIKKLEALKVKIPNSIIYFKAESQFYAFQFDNAKKTFELYLNKAGSKGKYYKKSLEMLLKLDEGNTSYKYDDYISKPLHMAACEGRVYLVKSLLDSGTPVDIETGWGSTALLLAVDFGNYKVAEVLIARGSNINATDSRGNTPLHKTVTGRAIKYNKASELRYNDLAVLLINKGADVNIKNNDGKTALDLAVEKKNSFVATYLKKHGAKRAVDL